MSYRQMQERGPENLTILLNRWGQGDAAAFDHLIQQVHPDLRQMASRYLSRERPGTIQATALVHDLYLRLLKQEKANFETRRAFFDQALSELAALDPRKAELVQLSAFLGCGRSEAAELLGVSERTVSRDLRLARAWLARRLGKGSDASR